MGKMGERQLLAYLRVMKVRNLYTIWKSGESTGKVYSTVGPVMKPTSSIDSFFKTPYRPRPSFTPEAEFSQLMMGIKPFKPFIKKESYFQ